MATFLDNPDPAKLRAHGPLGWLSDKDRQHYYFLPAMEFKPAIKKLEKHLAEHLKKLEERKTKVNTRLYLDALKDE